MADEHQDAHQDPFSQLPGQQQQHPHHGKQQEDQRYLTLSREVGDFLSRMRLLEERYANLRREHQTTNQNMIENHQHLTKQQRKLSDTLRELKRTLNDLKEQLGTMQGELADAANTHDLKTLEKYLDFWEPLDFITREEAERLIDEAASGARKFYKAGEGERE
jgi:ABC-type transporter Mla subunit MlaD